MTSRPSTRSRLWTRCWTIRSRANVSGAARQRGGHPADRRFTLLRVTGHAHVWVSECVTIYDGAPSYSASVMEFADQQVVHETQYFAGPFGAPAWRAALAEPVLGTDCRGGLTGLVRHGRPVGFRRLSVLAGYLQGSGALAVDSGVRGAEAFPVGSRRDAEVAREGPTQGLR